MDHAAGENPRASWPTSLWTPRRPIWLSTTVTLAASNVSAISPYTAFSRCRAQRSFARGGLGKALSIVAWRNSQYPEERTTHLLFAVETATISDRFDSVVCFLEQATRCVNSNRFHCLSGGAAALRCIDPCEVSGAHVHTVRKGINAEVALQVLHYPALQFAE
jgi:hypothetical protein